MSPGEICNSSDSGRLIKDMSDADTIRSIISLRSIIETPDDVQAVVLVKMGEAQEELVRRGWRKERIGVKEFIVEHPEFDDPDAWWVLEKVLQVASGDVAALMSLLRDKTNLPDELGSGATLHQYLDGLQGWGKPFEKNKFIGRK